MLLTPDEFKSKYAQKFADNEIQNVDEPMLREFKDDIADSFASVSSVSTNPVPPAVKFDTATRQLLAEHPLGTAELEYSRNNGAFAPYEPVQVDDAGHPQGEWRFRVRATGGRNVSAPSDSPLLNPKTQPVALTVGLSVGSATLTTGNALNYSVLASGGTKPYQHTITARNVNTGTVSQLATPTTAAHSGFWPNVPAGTYELQDTVRDAAGNQQASLIRRVEVTVQVAVPAGPAPEVTGFLPESGVEGTTVTITGKLFSGATAVSFHGTPASFHLVNASTIVAVVPIGATTGQVAVSTDTVTGTSTASFTVGVATPTPTTPTTPAATKATKPRFGSINDEANTVVCNSDYATTEVLWGVENEEGTQQLASNSICSPGNVVGRLFAYVVADASANRLQSDVAYSGAFSLNATANNAPTVVLTSPQAGQSLVVGDPVVLDAVPADADGSQDVKRIDHLDNGVKFAETTGFPHTVQRNLTLGSHSFTARVYDMVGASALSNAITVTATAPTTTPPASTRARIVFNEDDSVGDYYIATDGTRVKHPTGYFGIPHPQQYIGKVAAKCTLAGVRFQNHSIPGFNLNDATFDGPAPSYTGVNVVAASRQFIYDNKANYDIDVVACFLENTFNYSTLAQAKALFDLFNSQRLGWGAKRIIWRMGVNRDGANSATQDGSYWANLLEMRRYIRAAAAASNGQIFALADGDAPITSAQSFVTNVDYCFQAAEDDNMRVHPKEPGITEIANQVIATLTLLGYTFSGPATVYTPGTTTGGGTTTPPITGGGGSTTPPTTGGGTTLSTFSQWKAFANTTFSTVASDLTQDITITNKRFRRNITDGDWSKGALNWYNGLDMSKADASGWVGDFFLPMYENATDGSTIETGGILELIISAGLTDPHTLAQMIYGTYVGGPQVNMYPERHGAPESFPATGRVPVRIKVYVDRIVWMLLTSATDPITYTYATPPPTTGIVRCNAHVTRQGQAWTNVEVTGPGLVAL
jgi:hypothetical protein